MTLRNLMIATLLLVIAGCGCNDDSTPPGGTSPQVRPAVLTIKTQLPPIPVDPPQDIVDPIKIDVTFVLDDGDHMLEKVLGIIPSNPGDQRTRMQAAQAIFRNLQANLLTQFNAEWLAQNPGTTPPPLDLAFAVTRYEDFGGPFPRNRADGDVDDASNRNNDQDARPFILNMPILRVAHPQFADLFANALVRQAPGDGAPFIGFGANKLRAVDPQTGIEALYQIAAPTDQNGNIGGLDADGNGNTLGSGAPTSLTPAARDATAPIGPVTGGPFTAGEEIVFNPSGARGVVTNATADGDTDMAFALTTGSPINGDIATGQTSGASVQLQGAPAISPAVHNPQTYPGASGDVPAVRFVANGTDADGEPLFTVADENGVEVQIPNPAIGVGGTIPSPSSGNLGQVGWRPDAARFAILSSSIATVAPTETQPQGTPEIPGLLPPPSTTEMVSSTAGAPDAPREARSVLLGAFDGGPLLIAGVPYTQRRTGLRDGVEVSPTNAHTVNDAISRLNELDIEVLLLGTPIEGGLDTKPGALGVNGDDESDIRGDDFDPQDPFKVRPDFAPWFWFNAVNTLTTPPVTSIPPAGRVPAPVFGGDDTLFWGVYNMGNVWPYDQGDPTGTNEATIKSVMTDDLAERIVAWVDGNYVTGGTTPAVRPPLPTVSYTVSLDLSAGSNGDVIQVTPLDMGLPVTTFSTVVQVPTYWSDETAPAPVEVTFPVSESLQYTWADDMVILPQVTTIPFEMMAAFQMLGNMLPENATQQQQIIDFIKARGNGFDVDGMGNPVPLANETDPIIQAQASVNVTITDVLFPAPGAQLVAVTRGCAITNDLTPGQDASDQAGGTCPWPTNP